MALTYRLAKGSALTLQELDDNFSHFTGSHSITGSLTISGSIIPSETSGTLGTADNPWKELYVDGQITGSSGLFLSTSSFGNLDIRFENLPTASAGLPTGGLWLSGSDGAGSKHLMVYWPY